MVGYLSAPLDENLEMDSFVNSKCVAAHITIYNLRKIRKHLSIDICKMLVQSLVISKLDYCNGLLFGVKEKLLDKLQLVQNMAARLCLNENKFSSATDALYTLHWLPIRFRIKYKIVLTVFKSLNDMSPEYLSNMFTKCHNSQRQLRSNNKNLLVIPKTRCVSFGDRALSVCGAKLWNELPETIRSINDLVTFKKHLKTYYFREAFY